MNNQLVLKHLENAQEEVQDELLSDFLEGIEFEPSPESLRELETNISAFESAFGVTSERMLGMIDCESFEQDPELCRWAALYCSYKELKESI